MQREEELNDFSLPGIRGRELRGFTVGIIRNQEGSGRQSFCQSQRIWMQDIRI